jgi:hypothetical protein
MHTTTILKLRHISAPKFRLSIQLYVAGASPRECRFETAALPGIPDGRNCIDIWPTCQYKCAEAHAFAQATRMAACGPTRRGGGVCAAPARRFITLETMNLIDWKEADATVFRCGWKNDYEAIGRGLDTGILRIHLE